MRVSENRLKSDILDQIKGCANDAAMMLHIDTSRLLPKEIVGAVDSFVTRWQKGERLHIPDEDDPCFTLGSLWGEQITKAFGWQWAGVVFHDQGDSRAVGVLSPNRALAVYPFHFIHGCISNGAPVTILLAYNLLKDGSKIPPTPPNSYQNVMDCVHYLVPRE